jgi:uncharacterized protein (DUF1015 family)
MTVAHPIAHGWLSTGGTGAQNYDEFASDAEITEIIATNPASALAVEMPHRAPESVGRPFRDCLPDAVARFADAQRHGRYAPAEDLVALYRVSSRDGTAGYGLWCMVDTDQISTSADEPGQVIRNEDVFIEKVRERVALVEALGALLSPVLLLQTAHGHDLHAALARATAAAGPPATTDRDPAGRSHEVWALGPGAVRDELLALAGGGELVVADGNHRTLAAQMAGLPRFLAVITTPESVAIQAYNRLVTDVPSVPALIERLPGAVRVEAGDPVVSGTVQLYTREGTWAVSLPRDPTARVVANLDHALVERILFADALELEPGDKRITYVGGDYPATWLRAEVDADRADLAVLIAPVAVAEFVAVNLARDKMPRKSTWFTPKARAGLVVAGVVEAAPAP